MYRLPRKTIPASEDTSDRERLAHNPEVAAFEELIKAAVLTSNENATPTDSSRRPPNARLSNSLAIFRRTPS